MQLSLPVDASYVPITRNMASSLLSDLGVPDDAASDIQIVLSEACANVVRHSEGTGAYFVTLGIGADGCEIEVVDTGKEFDLPPAGNGEGQADLDAETGRGILLMRSLVDHFQFLREDEATCVRLVKRWPGDFSKLLSDAAD